MTVETKDVIELDGRYLFSLENHRLKPRPAKPQIHTHHYLELSYVKSGRGEYLVNDRVYDVQEGDIFIFNSVEKHGIGVFPPDELVNMVIGFDPRFILSMESNLFDARYLKIFFDRNDSFQNRLDRDNSATGEIRQMFLDIEEEFVRRQAEYPLMIKVKLLNILVALIRHFGYTRMEEEQPQKRKQALNFLNRVIDHISTHLSEEIRLEDLAGICYMNPSYFSTFFKKYIGVGPSEYIANRRVHYAIEQLRSTDDTILEVAAKCGFNSTSSFNKAFKKVTGRVPSDYRN